MATKVNAEYVPVPRALPPARERSDEQKAHDLDLLEALESGRHTLAYQIKDNEEQRKDLEARVRSSVRWANNTGVADYPLAMRQGQDGKASVKGDVVVVYALVKARKREKKDTQASE